MPLTLSDAASDDWACIGVRVLSIALVPQGGGAPVTVWSAPAAAPLVNLVQLDELGELLGNVSVPVGTYTAAVLTLGANPGDVRLATAANPPSGFPVAGGTEIPAAQIEVQHTQGTAGHLTVQTTVDFVAPLTVSASQTPALDLEFDLRHPAFIVGHTPPGAGATLWAVSFEGPVRHHPVHDITRLVLRHTYGTVTAVSGATLTMTRDYPVLPATNPETAVAGTQSLTIDADATYGTIVYDLDAGTRTVGKTFDASLSAKYVRIAARYQENGSLTAVRVWAGSSFAKVWVSPEGHVLDVDTTHNIITVTNELGIGVPVAIGADTAFYFRTPQDALADATPIGMGPAFLANQQLVRGFKVHVGSLNPLGVPLVADTVDIERAGFVGSISNATASSLTYTSHFAVARDNYSLTLGYVAPTAPNGFDGSDNPVTGFKWWDFTFPTTVASGSTGIADFVAATNGAVDFGGTVGSVSAWGASGATWGDGVSVTDNWHLRDAILVPTPLPLGTVSTAFDGRAFSMTVAGGAQPVEVDVSATPGSATLVYQLSRDNDVVTLTPLDITTSSGLAALATALAGGAPVKVYGVPQPPVAPATSGTLRAYVLVCFSGLMPAL